ncbi:alpha/beta hydrolase family protein [Lentzea sp. NPDC060358]|uniref:alpha/beta hydrolase family protein n=1 Tax=Lentzea sp. NPDC060358 TaxID=3347103 RepID=UPI00365B8EB7
MSTVRTLASVLAAASALVAGSATASAAPPDVVPCLGTAACASGQLSDGTPYQFAKPARWNGVVLVDLDFAAGGLGTPLTAALLGRGYAVGGTTRTVTGWRIAQAIDNQAAALGRFEEAFGPARWAVAQGRSMGGFVAAGAAQVHPGRFDAAVPMCGGLGGSVGQWNQKLDTVFTLKTLLFRDSALPVTGIPADVPGAQQQWISALAGAQATAGGRARIALASTIGQLPGWGLAADGTTTPVPAWWDSAGIENGMHLALAGGPLPYIGQAMSSRRAIEQVTGGNPSWNTAVDYGRQFALAEPSHQLAVLRLYAEAGLDLVADLRTLAAAPRVAADPAAVARFAEGVVFTGDVRVPVLTVNAIGDQISTVAQQQSYEELARRAGNGALVRQTYVRTAGHCTFTVGEQVAAIEKMRQRLSTGRWPDVSPRALNAQAGDGRYVDHTPPRFSRPYAG